MPITATLFIVFFAFLLINTPIGVALGVSALTALGNIGISFEMFPMQVYSNISKFLLLAIPFFILAGNIMEKSGISARLIRLADVFVGHRKGGLAIVAVITSIFFAAVSGSGPATVAALGVMLIPAMIKSGYGKAMPSALLASSGAIGVIIPPSIPFVVYGSISGVSIGRLFMAGIVPGLLMGLSLMIVSLVLVKKMNIQLSAKSTRQEKWKAFVDAFWGLLMPIIILGGIYGGFFTPTESAAVAAVYGIVVGVFVYRTINFKTLLQTLIDTAKGTASVMLVVACAALFAWILQISSISKQVSDFLLTATSNKYLFLVLVNIVLLIAGCFIDTISAMYIFVPIILPVAAIYGYDPIALGVLITMNLAIGLYTPPVGANLYVSSSIGNVTLSKISRAVVPFVLVSIIVLFVITYFPNISLFILNLL